MQLSIRPLFTLDTIGHFVDSTGFGSSVPPALLTFMVRVSQTWTAGKYRRLSAHPLVREQRRFDNELSEGARFEHRLCRSTVNDLGSESTKAFVNDEKTLNCGLPRNAD